jgi:DNA-binding CsgD family transcriptional regulator
MSLISKAFAPDGILARDNFQILQILSSFRLIASAFITPVTTPFLVKYAKIFFQAQTGFCGTGCQSRKVAMKRSRRCPVCWKALTEAEYEKALRTLEPNLVQYLRIPRQPSGTRLGKKLDLTRRELEIVSTVLAGCSNKDIAQHFKISEVTVKHHLSNIFDKLGVSTRLELALFAVNQSLQTTA